MEEDEEEKNYVDYTLWFLFRLFRCCFYSRWTIAVVSCIDMPWADSMFFFFFNVRFLITVVFSSRLRGCRCCTLRLRPTACAEEDAT